MTERYKDWELFDEMPDGFRFNRYCGSPLFGYAFANDVSLLKGGRLILVRAEEKKIDFTPANPRVEKMQPEKETPREMDENAPRVMNLLERKRFEQQMLRDILIDLQICEIEGWCKTEYIRELRHLIGGLLRNVGKSVDSNQTSLTI